MYLLALAYPTLSALDYKRIQAFRAQHDRYYSIVEPHFTLVFAVSDWKEDAFSAEIKNQLRGFQAFDFCIRCAVLNRDASGDLYHVFLTPDEGYSQIVKLHDRLYAGKLLPHRRLDIDFIPHIGIANSADPRQCLEWIESWNREEFEIRGRVTEVDMVRYDSKTVQTFGRMPLIDG